MTLDPDYMRGVRSYLAEQFRRGRPILVTGAGFSRAGYNLLGRPCPLATELASAIWDLVYPGEALEPGTPLQDIFEIARTRNASGLLQVLRTHLTIDHTKGDLAIYERLLSLPWYRWFSLNVDTLPSAVDARFVLPRPLRVIDGLPQTADVAERQGSIADSLFVVQLHGLLEKAPEGVTFGRLQYAARTNTPDPWYSTFASELMVRPAIFFGTQLDEPPLWDYIELRKSKGQRGLGEHRPRSFLITPSLLRSRAALLKGYNIEWLQMNLESFLADVVLPDLWNAKDEGLRALRALSSRAQLTDKNDARLFVVSELLDEIPKGVLDATARDFLFGAEPTWNDIRCGAATKRATDGELRRLFDGPERLLIVTGTAATGKSTCAKRLALDLHAEGRNAGWIDQFHRPRVLDIRRACERTDGPSIILIEDSDIYGDQLESLIREILVVPRLTKVVVVVRSTLVERFLAGILAMGDVAEHTISTLSDTDIDGVIGSLERYNRLGVLKNMPPAKQRLVFKEKCGSQLLVAMMEATSGVAFDDKCRGEYTQLTEPEKRFYEVACLATARRIVLQKEDLILATQQQDNAAVSILDAMITRGLLTQQGGTIRARHRMISERVLGLLIKENQLASVVSGLLFALCLKIDFSLPRRARPWRNVAALINNEYLHSLLGVDSAEQVFASVEQLLTDDFHFWLQRGALQLKFGQLLLARNFLDQAYGLEPDDLFVRVERSYMLLKFAYSFPHGPNSREMAGEAIATLTELVDGRGKEQGPVYHTLGSQGLAWSRRGALSPDERTALLALLEKKLAMGLSHIPRNPEIRELHDAIRRERIAVGASLS